MSGLSCLAGAALGFLLSFVGALFAESQVQIDTALASAMLPSLLAAVFGLLTAITFAAPERISQKACPMAWFEDAQAVATVKDGP